MYERINVCILCFQVLRALTALAALAIGLAAAPMEERVKRHFLHAGAGACVLTVGSVRAPIFVLYYVILCCSSCNTITSVVSLNLSVNTIDFTGKLLTVAIVCTRKSLL